MDKKITANLSVLTCGTFGRLALFALWFTNKRLTIQESRLALQEQESSVVIENIAKPTEILIKALLIEKLCYGFCARSIFCKIHGCKANTIPKIK